MCWVGGFFDFMMLDYFIFVLDNFSRIFLLDLFCLLYLYVVFVFIVVLMGIFTVVVVVLIICCSFGLSIFPVIVLLLFLLFVSLVGIIDRHYMLYLLYDACPRKDVKVHRID